MKWYKHDSNAHMDAKLQDVLLDYGLEGYGLYWYCLELITNKVDKDCANFELEHDSRIIARNTGSTPAKVTDMMKTFVTLGLFEDLDGKITCLKLAKRIDKSMTSNKEMRLIIEQFRKSHDETPNNHDKASNSHDLIMTESAKPMQEEKRVEEIRGEDKKDLSSFDDDQERLSNIDSYEKMPAKKAYSYASEIYEVFTYWMATMSKKSNTALSTERKAKIKKRLSEGYTVSEIQAAILNCSNTDHNMGRGPNSSGTKYNDIELICRNSVNLERFRDNPGTGRTEQDNDEFDRGGLSPEPFTNDGDTFDHDSL